MKRGTAISNIYMWVAALLCIVCIGAQAKGIPNLISLSCNTEVAVITTGQEADYEYASTIRVPDDNQLKAKRESNRWALSTASVRVRCIAGSRTSTGDTMQRVMRTQGATQNESYYSTSSADSGMESAISFKRFHTGYYIYHRCQMRC